VVVLHAARERTAGHACERILQAIRSERWDDIAEGLHVEVSVGLARAEAGDTLETLLHRSDTAMYALKRSQQAKSGPALGVMTVPTPAAAGSNQAA
jgi:GGDEF domain-containing protein